MDVETDLPPVAVFKRRTNKSTLRKRPATPPSASSSSEYSDNDDQGHRIKRRKGGVAAGSSAIQTSKPVLNSTTTQYAADRSTTIAPTSDATKSATWYDDTVPDALSAKALLGSTRAAPVASDGTYKGTAAYSSFITPNPNARAPAPVGPRRGGSNVRTITITDYSPDVCKDYKTTGFCGFGDGCKFLHAREDYKQGWALDKEWEKNTKGKKQAGTVVSRAGGADEEEGDEGDKEGLEKIPFACVICKGPYKQPVVTVCGHYYCEGCALQRYKKSQSCAACGARTNGVFNAAKNLQKLLDKKKAREERIKAKEEEEKADEE